MQPAKSEGVNEMTDQNFIDTEVLVRCSNKECRQLIGQVELKQNDGKCPYCAKKVWETE
jgi:hypothetical protein